MPPPSTQSLRLVLLEFLTDFRKEFQRDWETSVREDLEQAQVAMGEKKFVWDRVVESYLNDLKAILEGKPPHGQSDRTNIPLWQEARMILRGEEIFARLALAQLGAELNDPIRARMEVNQVFRELLRNRAPVE